MRLAIFICVGLLLGKFKASSTEHCTCSYFDYNHMLQVKCPVSDPEEIKACLYAHRNATILILQNNSLTSVPGSINILEQLSSLDLSHNEIPRIDFRNAAMVCRNIQYLQLDFNKINILVKGDLDCFSSLKAIYLANNSLRYIEAGSFNGYNTQLQYIHMINNQLTHIDFSLLLFPPLMTFGGRVNASWNNISKMTNDLSYTIMDFDLSMSFFVALKHNNITGVDVKYYLRLLNVTNILELYRLGNGGFDVRFNPFLCDCALYNLAKYLKIFRPMDPDNPLFSITCYNPISLRGKLIYQVSPTDFNCSVADMCPGNCECTETVAVGLVSVDCGDLYEMTRLPNDVPTSRELHISIHSPWLSVISSKRYMKNVTILDVSQSQVTNIENNVINDLDNIKNVFLHDNALQILPIGVQHMSFHNINTLTLYGNPFRCDCNSLWVKKWLLQNKKNIPMQDKILCGSGRGKGHALVDVADSDFLCEEDDTVDKLIIYAMAVVVLTFMIVCFILTRTKIHLLMIEYINSSWCRKKVRSDLDYDLFISHSSLDDKFVHDFLIPKLLHHTPPYRVFIDERHFIPGKSIAYNINRAIENSHTTLMVVSNNFLDSKWCMMEFRQAHLRLLRDRDINLVIIVLGELNKDLLDDELKLYMQTHIYLCESDKYFWSKLLQALPILISESVGSRRVPVERSISANGAEFSENGPLIQ